jgi:hypothetical protein
VEENDNGNKDWALESGSKLAAATTHCIMQEGTAIHRRQLFGDLLVARGTLFSSVVFIAMHYFYCYSLS